MVRDPEMDAGMFSLARPIKHQHNLLGRTGPCSAREFGRFDLKHRSIHDGNDIGKRTSGGGTDVFDQIAPGVAALDNGGRA